MHPLARSLARAGCSSTRAVRLSASSWRSTAAAATSTPLLRASAPRRNHHVRVPLPYKIENGMGDFLPPAALKVIAEDYQQGLLDRLNDQIKGALFHTSCGCISVSEIFRADRHEAREPERRPNRHLDRSGREPNARVQLREPRAEQLIFPAPPRTFSHSTQSPLITHSLSRNPQEPPHRTTNPR